MAKNRIAQLVDPKKASVSPHLNGPPEVLEDDVNNVPRKSIN